MKVRRLDANHDTTWGNGLGDFLTGVYAVAQVIQTSLLLLMGEWFANLNNGLPFWQAIAGYAGTNKETVDNIIIERILSVQGVQSVISFSSSYISSSRQYSCTALVNTIYGSVQITTTL